MDFPPPESLALETVSGSRPGIRILRPAGPITIHNFERFQEATLHEPPPPALLIDLSEVPYLDSSALGVFVRLHVVCEQTGRRYALVHPNSRLKQLFDLSNVNEFLVVYDSLAEAETAMNS